MANGNKKKKIIIISIIAVVVIAVVAFALMGKKDTGVTVNVETVQKKDIVQVVTASGKIYPKVEVKISPDVSGEVIELAIEEGQIVRKGDFLARIKPDFYVFQKDQSEANLTSATAMSSSSEAQLDKARTEYKRVKEMYDKKLVSDQEVEAAKTTLHVAEQSAISNKADITRAKASLDQSMESLRKTSLYAPIDGIVSSLTVEKGERVVGTSQFSGTEIMRVADFGKMEVRVNVNENDVINVNIGDTARISVDAMKGKTFVGTVTEIAHTPVTSGAGTQEEVTNFPVKITIINPDKGFRSGLSATVDIETDRAVGVFAVPIQSVTIKREMPVMGAGPDAKADEGAAPKVAAAVKPKSPEKIVFIVDAGIAKAVVVETGISDDRYIQIKKGLTGTEQIVTGSYRAISRELEDGKKVKVDEPKKIVAAKEEGK